MARRRVEKLPQTTVLVGPEVPELALFDNGAVVAQDKDVVTPLDRAQPVCYADGGHVADPHQPLERLVDGGLTLAVKGTRGLVQDQDRRLLDQAAGQSHLLSLASRQQRAPGPDVRIEALGQRVDEVAVGLLGGPLDVGPRRPPSNVVRKTVPDVLVNGALDQHGLLLDKPKRLSHRVHGELGDVVAVDEDLPRRRLVEPEQQRRNRRLASARRPHYAHVGARRNVERQLLEDRVVRPRWIRELDIFETDVALADDFLPLDRVLRAVGLAHKTMAMDRIDAWPDV